MAFVHVNESDQTGCPPNLISHYFIITVAKDLSFLHDDTKDSDQAGQKQHMMIFLQCVQL